MKSEDQAWNQLTATWREGEAAPFDARALRRVLRRRRAVMALVIAGELAISLALVWYTIWLLRSRAEGSVAVLLTGLWLFWAVATGFAWWNRRGQWRHECASLDDFIKLSLERAQRKIRVVWFSLGLLVAEVAFLLWFSILGPSPGPGGVGLPTRIVVPVTVVALYLGWAVWYYRRARRELAHFTGLRDPQGEAADLEHR